LIAHLRPCPSIRTGYPAHPGRDCGGVSAAAKQGSTLRHPRHASAHLGSDFGRGAGRRPRAHPGVDV